MGANVFAYTSFAEEFEQLQLPKSPQTEHRMVERGNLLDRNLSAGGTMDGRANDTVGTLSYDIKDLILRTWEKIRVNIREIGEWKY